MRWGLSLLALLALPLSAADQCLGVRPRILQLYGSGANEIGT